MDTKIHQNSPQTWGSLTYCSFSLCRFTQSISSLFNYLTKRNPPPWCWSKLKFPCCQASLWYGTQTSWYESQTGDDEAIWVSLYCRIDLGSSNANHSCEKPEGNWKFWIVSIGCTCIAFPLLLYRFLKRMELRGLKGWKRKLWKSRKSLKKQKRPWR